MGLPAYPDPASATPTGLPSVWYATQARVRDPFRWKSLDDKGGLAVWPGHVRFVGQRTTVDCPDVRAIGLERQAFPLLTFVLTNAVLLGLIYGGVLRTFTPDNPLTWPLVAALNLLTLVVNGFTRWVWLEYADSGCGIRRAYFVDGWNFGRGRVFGGTTRLYESLRATVLGQRPDDGPGRTE